MYPAVTVSKPWGREEWLALNASYCMKVIRINAGFQTSEQYHRQKRETNLVIEGHGNFLLDGNWSPCRAGDAFTIEPGQVHRIVARTDLVIVECSTPEVDDVVRISDDTGRPDGRIASEHGE